MSGTQQALLFGGIAGDANFANVVSLLHADGTDGTQVFTDQKSKVWTPKSNTRTWSFSDNAQLDTAQALFGSSSLLLDGTGDFISAPDSADFEMGSGDFTIEIAFRFATLGGIQNLCSKWTATGNQRSYILRAETDSNNLQWIWSVTGSATAVTLQSSVTWATGQWYRATISRVGATWYLFLDGALLTSGTAATPFATGTAIFKIGNTDSSNYFNGWIDEFRFTKGVGRYTANYTVDAAAFPHTLTLDTSYASVVSLLHFDGADAATAIDDRAKTPGLDTSQKLFGTASIAPNGLGWVETPDSADFEFGNGDFTVEMAVRFTAFTADQYILTKYTATLNQREWTLRVDSTGANLRFAYSLDGTTGAEDIAGAFTFSTGTWYRVAVTRSGTTIRLFVDGTVVGSSSTISTSSIHSGTSPARIGGLEAGSPVQGFISGNVDEIRVTKGVARYTAGYTPATAAFPDF